MLFYIFLLLIIIFTALWFTNHKFRYNVKFGSMISVVMISAIVMLPVLLLRPRNVVNIQ